MKKWVWAAVPAVIIGAYAATAVYSGSKAEEVLQEGIKKANIGKEWQFEWAKYDRGVFRSKAVLDIIFTPGNGEDMYRHSLPITVVHGPLLLDGTLGFKPAMFGMKSAVVAREDWPEDVKKLLADDRVHFESVFSFGQKATFDFTIEEGEMQLTTGNLDLKELHMQFSFDADSKEVKGEGSWPGLKMSGMMGDVVVRDWAMNWDGVQYDAYTGTGTGELTLAEVKMSQGGAEQFAMNAFKMTSKQDMNADKSQLNGELNMSIDSVNTQGQNVVSKLDFFMQFDKLSAAGIRAMNEFAKDPENTEDPMMMLNTVGQQVLEFGPEINARLSAEQVMRQPLNVNAKLTLPPMPNGFEPTWMQGILFSMDGKVPLTLVGMALPTDLVALLSQGETDDKGTAFKVEWREGQLWINANPYMPGMNAQQDEQFDPAMMEDYQEECVGEDC